MRKFSSPNPQGPVSRKSFVASSPHAREILEKFSLFQRIYTRYIECCKKCILNLVFYYNIILLYLEYLAFFIFIYLDCDEIEKTGDDNIMAFIGSLVALKCLQTRTKKK